MCKGAVAPRNQNYHFSIQDEKLFIVDTSKMPIECECCGVYVDIEHDILYNDYTAYYGKINLPVQILDLNILDYALTILFDEPSFGTFMFGVDLRVVLTPFIIIYCPGKTITQNEASNYKEIDNKPICCFFTRDNNLILVNSDGNILETEIFYSNDTYEFKTKNGTLKAPLDICEPTWKYIADTALKTKPAATIQELD